MWCSIVRDSPLGQIIRMLWKPQFLTYIDERKSNMSGRDPPNVKSWSTNHNDNNIVSQCFEPNSLHIQDATTFVGTAWYSENDSENPQNWPLLKKSIVSAVIWYVQLPLKSSRISVTSGQCLRFYRLHRLLYSTSWDPVSFLI